MVSTRNHPTAFPPPAITPTKNGDNSPSSDETSPHRRNPSSFSSSSPSTPTVPWAHTPHPLTLVWLLISLPLVAWDCGFILLRPLTFPGGTLHSPLWVPYALYGRIDKTYAIEAVEGRDGWPGAQGLMNVVETLAYGGYLWVVLRWGKSVDDGSGRGKMKKKEEEEEEEEQETKITGTVMRAWSTGRGKVVVDGRWAGRAVLLGFTAAVMTVSKTLLYFLIEYYSGFRHISHNDVVTLFFLWIVPNGSWIAMPTCLCYIFGSEILGGLKVAAALGKRKSR